MTVAVIQIVADYLKKHKFDGLVAPDGECGCVLDNLVPCDSETFPACYAGYKVPCTCGEGCGWHIATKKQSIEAK